MFRSVTSRCRIALIALGAEIIIVADQALVTSSAEVALHAVIAADPCEQEKNGKFRVSREAMLISSSFKYLCQQQQHQPGSFIIIHFFSLTFSDGFTMSFSRSLLCVIPVTL